MKTKLCLILACLCCLAGLTLAQTADQPPTMSVESMQRILKSPWRQYVDRKGIENSVRSNWNSQSVGGWGVLNPDLRAAVGISEEQYQQWQQASRAKNEESGKKMREDPEFQRIMEEQMAIDKKFPFLIGADEETMKRFIELDEREHALDEKYHEGNDLTELLTPEQNQKIGEVLLANMGDVPYFSPNMFEALNLTDAQRQEMEEVKKELEPELEKNIGFFVNELHALKQKMDDEMIEMVKRGTMSEQDDRTKFRETMKAAQQKVLSDPVFKERWQKVMSQSQAFATQFRIKMFDVLTDEQWVRLQNLIDNPPEHAKIFRKTLRERMGESEKKEEWVPGPNSWQPGDPIPEGYREQRNTPKKFPRPTGQR